MTASYIKLKDESWGVRVQGTARPGQTITVNKKSGESKTETIKSVVWRGNGVTLCSIERSSTGTGAAKPAQRGVCSECGERCNPNYRKCRDCGMEGGSRYRGGQSYTTSDGRFILGDDD